jgi:kynureninase
MALEEARRRAVQLDSDDSLKHIRDEFLVPSKADIASSRLGDNGMS